jgi:hypothetical protein
MSSKRPNQHRKAKHPFSFVARPTTGSDTTWRTEIATRVGSEWEPIKILSLKELDLYPDFHPKHTSYLVVKIKITLVNKWQARPRND